METARRFTPMGPCSCAPAQAGDWFHYSVDYRIGRWYVCQFISDSFKREPMKVPLLRELLMSDLVFITFVTLAFLSIYLGKPG